MNILRVPVVRDCLPLAAAFAPFGAGNEKLLPVNGSSLALQGPQNEDKFAPAPEAFLNVAR